MSSLFRNASRFLLPVMMLIFVCGAVERLAAQGTTATILGIVTDSTGAAIPEAAVQVKNVGTGQTQSVQSDPQGRYRISDLTVGDYEAQAAKGGFSTVVRKGISLTVGSQPVVDFTLSVGQTQQTVTVEGAVTQVETTSSSVSTLISQTQMRELPLNGRNFEQLIQSAPGVQNYYAGTSGLNMREGRDQAISVAGSRPEGVALLMDDQSLETFYNRGLGSITGSSLGVDAIAEFQTLTNTYGAQYGGSGAAMNAVSKSGTNDLHGSLYGFLRNSALDARNFTDPSTIPAYRRIQYGATLGGPIKKDKLFLFGNYEGVRFVQGISQTPTVLANLACPTTCRLTSTATDPKTAAAINAVIGIFPLPQFAIAPIAGSTTIGTGKVLVVQNNTAHENYFLGRGDYNISEKDSFMSRYFIDLQVALYPYSGGNVGLWPENENGANQFFNMEERHIFSPTVVNIVRGSFSRTNANSSAGATHDALQMYPSSNRPDATIAIGGGVTTIGTGGASPEPENQIQNRFTEADDIALTRGAHSIRLGGAIERIQSFVYWPFQGQSSWSFGSIPTFLAGTATSVTGVLNVPTNVPVRYFRNFDFALYAQDDWKVSSKLTLNVGLRYEPMSNPVELNGSLNTIVNWATDSSFTNVPHVMVRNPSLKNFDPRVGFAFDPFKDHKTSIRGGVGIFHEVLGAGIWSIGFINSPPWSTLVQQSPAGQNTVVFQNPSVGGGAAPFTLGSANPSQPAIAQGYAYQIDRTPYMIQYNLNVQREIVQGTVLTVGYVGSHGVNLISGEQQVPVGYNIDAAGTYHFNGVRVNPAIGNSILGVVGTNSRYNSLQASVNRRMTHGLQAAASYTYSRCEGTGDASLGSLSGNSPTAFSNPYNRQADFSICGFSVTHAFRLNGLYSLPFHGNRFADGWQLSGLMAASTGLPFNVTVGAAQDNQLTGVPRPDYAPNNPATGIYPACNNSPYIRTVNMWFNPNCFNQEAYGTLGNFAREGLYGPGLVNVDFGVLKTTRIREGVTLQFRGEVFNLLNHTNLSYPASVVFSGTASPTATLARNSTAGQITTYAAPSREIQLGFKLVF